MGERADRDLVDPGLGDVADVLERDAAGGLEARAAADERDGGAHRRGVMLSRRIASAPAASASDTCSSVSHSTSTGSGVAARSRSTAVATEPAARRWLSLTSTPSSSPKRWFFPPPQATACFSSTRRPGRRLARVEDRGAGALDRVDVAAGQRRDPGEPREEVQRRALAGEDRALGPGHAGDGGAGVHGRPFVDERLEAELRIERAEHRLGDPEPADDAGLLHDEVRRARRVGVDGGLGGDVAVPHVLGEGREGDARSSASAAIAMTRDRLGPGRRTTWRSNAASVRGSRRGSGSRGSPRGEGRSRR